MDGSKPILECRKISKTFPGVNALCKVDFNLKPGEIHGLVGENGAGKSTLIKIISGVYQHDEIKPGEQAGMFFEGKKAIFKTPNDALKAKIMTIHQEINVAYDLSVYENIFLNHEYTRLRLLDRKKMIGIAQELLERFEADVDAKAMAKDLPTDKQKLIEIFKAISQDAKVLIMDEPTSVLTEVESQHCFKVMKNIAEKNIGIIFISHNLKEVVSICDRVTVLRDGKLIGTLQKEELSIDRLVTMMVGKKIEETENGVEKIKSGEVLLQVKNLSLRNQIKNISFDLKAGEIIGITGLVGSGGTELVKTLFGAENYNRHEGEIYLGKKKLQIKSPKDAIKNGIALLTEDRKREGLFLQFKLYENITIPAIHKFINIFRIMNKKKRLETASNYIKALSIKANGPEVVTETLSGGNQQKVVISKWLETDPKVFIMDEPTVGVDVAAKFEIRKIIRSLAKEGKGVILVTNEYAELKNLCNRVLIMFKGEIILEVEEKDINEEDILKYTLGGIKTSDANVI